MKPWFFLPGFMGNSHDFNHLAEAMGLPAPVFWQWPEVDAPVSFEHYAQLAWQHFRAQLPAQFSLYAYSMGGRIASFWWRYDDFQQRCQALVIAGSHPGLAEAQARLQRAQHDARWVQAFASQPLCDVLQRWYQQPVFASLSGQQKARQIANKLQRSGVAYAQILQSASLAHQPLLGDSWRAEPRLSYVAGELDEKFLTLAQQYCCEHQLIRIADCGHMAHWEKPAALADALATRFNTGNNDR
ncbi:alpha/beta fold hydrolase [Reinekea marinisedimentorum]|uniref:2-succinyl-6-hydroxy-2, 4-cyclohexadiene-1-carboxylate synthase n=1 Tax=Reinekea marinisedimentorum TaxID=230495 RepID=A0A4R3I1T8_9GAMM|nr:alpha/beta fold hydrolase [Reinekea marinisedimentorum]TCS39726.1 2-succinyl-6-hydroxy-2,4-cyclohexadiene-1-carboxylate synthase [Reinekea marinisedimentorum]